MYPELKTALLSAAAGAAGAYGADVAAHDEWDRAASMLRRDQAALASLPAAGQEELVNLFAAAADGEQREALASVLRGTPVAQVTGGVPLPSEDLQKAIIHASELAAGNPDLARQVAAVGMQMADSRTRLADERLDPAAVYAHMVTGAGTSSLPAILGAAGLGTGGAILQHQLYRRGADLDAQVDAAMPGVRDSFRVRRN